MRQISQCLLLGLGVVAVSGAAQSPYASIAGRNVFGLKPAPPPAAQELASAKPPAPKVTLLGITTLLGKKRALLKTTPPASAAGPAKELSLMLAEGQREGELEVIHVDEKAAVVTVDDYGTITNVTFDKDSLKSPAPRDAAPTPPRPALANQPAPGARGIPARNLRPLSPPAAATANAGSVAQPPLSPAEQLLLTALQPEPSGHDSPLQAPPPAAAIPPPQPSLPADDPRLAPRGELPNE